MMNHIPCDHIVVNSSDSDEWDHDYDGGLAIEEEKPKLKPPKQYKVLVMNDDYTPMEFVVQVLTMFFAMAIRFAPF